MTYKIGSFNMRNLSYRSNRDFDKIAQIIDEEDFDIVAMQEVLNENVFNQLLKCLHPGKKQWAYRWFQPKLKNNYDTEDKRGEGYAYLWNTKRIDLVKTSLADGTVRESQPVIWSQYSKKNGGRLEREPYYARFSPAGKPGGSFFEIRLINTHIIYGDTKFERLEEFHKLVENVYVNIANRRYGNNMPAYTILLGDYNLTTTQIQSHFC